MYIRDVPTVMVLLTYFWREILFFRRRLFTEHLKDSWQWQKQRIWIKNKNNGEAFSSGNTRKKNFPIPSPQQELNPWLSRIPREPRIWRRSPQVSHGWVVKGTNQYFWKVMGSTPVEGWENSFSEDFDLRTLLRYQHFLQVTIYL